MFILILSYFVFQFTGIVMQAAKRLQINVMVEKLSAFR